MTAMERYTGTPKLMVPAFGLGVLGLLATLAGYFATGAKGEAAHSYLIAFVYPGLALTLLRSFIEHRPAGEQVARSALVEAGPVMSLLYLNNNLHALHHAAPQIAWYRLPSVYRECRAALLRRNSGFHYAGYLQVLRRFALRGKDSPVAPSAREAP